MANMHNYFLDFNSDLNIIKSKEEKLSGKREILKTRITKYFKENHPEYIPKYFIQGSYKMKNVIQTKDNLCDLDLAVMFEREPNVTGTTLQKWVYNAVHGHTELQIHKSRCIRVDYQDDFHIDLPVYHWNADKETMLCIKNQDSERSQPKKFVQWYRDEKSTESHRISKYLKAWGDNIRHNMLTGLAHTILSIRESNIDTGRDDISLLNSLRGIQSSLLNSWYVEMPTEPHDNVIDKNNNSTFKNNFFDRLDEFIDDAQEVINCDSEHKASKLWRKHLGDRIPFVEKEKSANNALAGIASQSIAKPWYYGNTI